MVRIVQDACGISFFRLRARKAFFSERRTGGVIVTKAFTEAFFVFRVLVL
jgi:hypothetical protein